MLVVAHATNAQDPFFSTELGSKSNYQILDKNGKVIRYSFMKVTKANGDLNNGEMTMAYDFLDADKRSVIGNETLDLTMTITNGVKTATLNNMGKALKSRHYMPKDNVASIPATIAIGDKIEDDMLPIKVGFVKATNKYTNREVIGRESVTVPAGTYDCFVVVCIEESNGDKFQVKSWMASGVGTVKQIVCKENGEFMHQFELIK